MAQVVVSLSAQRDTAEIVRDLRDKAGRRIAASYIAAFEALYERLAAHPDSGSPRPALGRDIRMGIVLPYVVIYRHSGDENRVAIVRIVHGSRRITRRLLGPAT